MHALLTKALLAVGGLVHLAAVDSRKLGMWCRGVYSGLPGIVTVMWGLYNCIGPYLLLHYTYIGRQRTLATASLGAMSAALGLAVLAVALLVAFTPTAHDFAQVSPKLASLPCSCVELGLARLLAPAVGVMPWRWIRWSASTQDHQAMAVLGSRAHT